MTKPFNIHDWQAKQRLTENDDAYQKRQDDMTPGKNPKYFYDDEYKKLRQKYSGAQGSMDNADIQSLQNLVQKYSLDKILVTLGITGDRALPIQLKKPSQGEDMNENTDATTERKINNFIKSLANLNDYTLQAAVNVIMRVLRSQNYDGVNEHHNDEDFPGKDLSAWDLLDKIKAGNEDLYDKVEDFMKSMNEMSSTGTGALVSAGASEAFATPNAFKKKKK